jgi:hypothetical protein
MGKVYVLRKNEGASAGAGPNMAVGPQGMSIVMGMSPEKVNYAQYGAGVDDKGNPYGGSAGQEKWARNFGNIGSKARVGLGALSGLNSLYNATSSGQPGALSAFGQGAMGPATTARRALSNGPLTRVTNSVNGETKGMQPLKPEMNETPLPE